tara:strand:- start:2484 stop:3809 length:1326 start_codon:yes stop_codon:yes gene_type:complete
MSVFRINADKEKCMSELKDVKFIDVLRWTSDSGAPLPNLVDPRGDTILESTFATPHQRTRYSTTNELYIVITDEGEKLFWWDSRLQDRNVGKKLTPAASQTLRSWEKGESRKAGDCYPSYYSNKTACDYLTTTSIERAVVNEFLTADLPPTPSYFIGNIEGVGKMYGAALSTPILLTRTAKEIPTPKYRKTSKKSVWAWTEREHWNRVGDSTFYTTRTGLVRMSSDMRGSADRARVQLIDKQIPTIKLQADFKKLRFFFQFLRGVNVTDTYKPSKTTLFRDPAKDLKYDPLARGRDAISTSSHKGANFRNNYLADPALLIRSALTMTSAPAIVDDEIVMVSIEESLANIPEDFSPVKKYISTTFRDLNRLCICNHTTMFFVYLNENGIISNDVFDTWATLNSYEYQTPPLDIDLGTHPSYKQYRLSDSAVLCTDDYVGNEA